MTFDWPSGFWEEDVERVWTTDGQQSLPIYYKLTYEPKGSGELKKGENLNLHYHNLINEKDNVQMKTLLRKKEREK